MSSLPGNRTAQGRNLGLSKETQFLVLSCSGCASAEPYPSQNGLTVEPKPMQQTSPISKYSKNSTFDLTILRF